MTPEFIYCYSHCPVWNNFEKEKQRSACFKRKAKVFSPHHLQSRWAATNAKGPYVKPCGWLWALPKPWSLYSLLDLDLQPRLSGPFLHSRPKKQNYLLHGVLARNEERCDNHDDSEAKAISDSLSATAIPCSQSSFLPRQFWSTSKHQVKSLNRLQTPSLLWVGHAAVSPVCVYNNL